VRTKLAGRDERSDAPTRRGAWEQAQVSFRTPGALRNNVAACHSGVLGCRSAAKGRLGVAAVERLMYQFFDVDAVLRGELNKH
jgi:hypothetical protein